ncbi:MAG: putative amidohydrolase [Chitinophagales bacterium]|jgi:predicted amidohydrolase
MSKTFRTACIQNTATRDINANINWVCNRIDEAYAAGAEFITMPESVGLIEQVNGTISAQCFTEQRDVGLIAFQNKAKQLKVTILVS